MIRGREMYDGRKMYGYKHRMDLKQEWAMPQEKGGHLSLRSFIRI